MKKDFFPRHIIVITAIITVIFLVLFTVFPSFSQTKQVDSKIGLHLPKKNHVVSAKTESFSKRKSHSSIHKKNNRLTNYSSKPSTTALIKKNHIKASGHTSLQPSRTIKHFDYISHTNINYSSKRSFNSKRLTRHKLDTNSHIHLPFNHATPSHVHTGINKHELHNDYPIKTYLSQGDAKDDNFKEISNYEEFAQVSDDDTRYLKMPFFSTHAEPSTILAIDMGLENVNLAKKAGFLIIQYHELKNLGITIAKLKPQTKEEQTKLLLWLKKHNITRIAPNSYYKLDRALKSYSDYTHYPSRLINWPFYGISSGINKRIGMIDSQIDDGHYIFRGKKIFSKKFYEGTLICDEEHASSIASMIVGSCNQGVCGLLQDAEIYSAVVFSINANGNCRATALSIAQSLDWLIGKRVQVINMSFDGPNNVLLKLAIKKVLEKNIAIIASAGNNGLSNQKVYPAAYSGVLAVTAVDVYLNHYLKANQGDFIDFSAPGVLVPVPYGEHSPSFMTGTSFAAVYCTCLASLLLNGDESLKKIKQIMVRDAKDLGRSGKDNVFGWGLARCGKSCIKQCRSK